MHKETWFPPSLQRAYYRRNGTVSLLYYCYGVDLSTIQCCFINGKATET